MEENYYIQIVIPQLEKLYDSEGKNEWVLSPGYGSIFMNDYVIGYSSEYHKGVLCYKHNLPYDTYYIDTRKDFDSIVYFEDLSEIADELPATTNRNFSNDLKSFWYNFGDYKVRYDLTRDFKGNLTMTENSMRELEHLHRYSMSDDDMEIRRVLEKVLPRLNILYQSQKKKTIKHFIKEAEF